MSDEVTFFQKVGPWILSVIFGIGSGVGAGRLVLRDHENRIKTVENSNHSEVLMKETHKTMCDLAQAQTEIRFINLMDEKFNEFKKDFFEELNKRLPS